MNLVIQKLVPFQQKHGEHVKQEAKQENFLPTQNMGITPHLLALIIPGQMESYFTNLEFP